MTYKELQQKSPAELQRLLAQTRETLRAERFKVAQGQQKDVREIRTARQDIARMMTVINRPKATT